MMTLSYYKFIFTPRPLLWGIHPYFFLPPFLLFIIYRKFLASKYSDSGQIFFYFGKFRFQPEMHFVFIPSFENGYSGSEY